MVTTDQELLHALDSGRRAGWAKYYEADRQRLKAEAGMVALYQSLIHSERITAILLGLLSRILVSIDVHPLDPMVAAVFKAAIHDYPSDRADSWSWANDVQAEVLKLRGQSTRDDMPGALVSDLIRLLELEDWINT